MMASLADGRDWSVPCRPNWFLWGLLALTLLVRAPGLDRPLLGDFGTKNVVYAMIARNWALGRADFWHPTLDCQVAAGERSWHLLEVPLSAYAAGTAWRLLGGSLDAWGRLISIVASVASVAWLYGLVRRWHGESIARPAAVMLALAPVSIVYGQSFMLEASVVALMLATMLALERWLERPGGGRLTLLALSFALLTLSKIYMLVLLAPLVCRVLAGRSEVSARAWETWSARLRRAAAPAFALGVAALPALMWCVYVFVVSNPTQDTAARIFYSLRSSAGAHEFPQPLLVQPGFYLRLSRTLATVVLTPVGLGLLVVGLRAPGARRHLPWCASLGLLVLLLPRKFSEMNYYFLVLLPPLCVLAGLGVARCRQVATPRWLPRLIVVLGVLFSLRYALRPAFVTPVEDRMVVAAGARLRALTDVEEPIATMHGSALDLLYYADRTGVALDRDAPDTVRRLAALRGEGFRTLGVAEADFGRLSRDVRHALDQHQLIDSGEGFRIYRLVPASPDRLAASSTGARE